MLCQITTNWIIKGFSMARKTVKGLSIEDAKKFYQAMGSIASSTKRVNEADLLKEQTKTFKSTGFQVKVTEADRKRYEKLKRKQSRGELWGKEKDQLIDLSYNIRNFDAMKEFQSSLGDYDVNALAKAFRMRQDDVFSRRAQPGVSAQTRLV